MPRERCGSSDRQILHRPSPALLLLAHRLQGEKVEQRDRMRSDLDHTASFQFGQYPAYRLDSETELIGAVATAHHQLDMFLVVVASR